MVEDAYLEENKQIVSKLMRVPSLKAFSEADIDKLLRLSRIRRYPAGHVIFEEGSFDKRIYYLVSGRASIIKNGREIASLQRTGDVFGEMGAIAGSSRSASVRATAETVCVEIDLASLETAPDESQFAFRYMIYRGFAEVLANRLRITTEALLETRNEIAQLKKIQQK